MEPSEAAMVSGCQHCTMSSAGLCERCRPNVVRAPRQGSPFVDGIHGSLGDGDPNSNASVGPGDGTANNGRASEEVTAGGPENSGPEQGHTVEEHGPGAALVPFAGVSDRQHHPVSSRTQPTSHRSEEDARNLIGTSRSQPILHPDDIPFINDPRPGSPSPVLPEISLANDTFPVTPPA